MNKFKHLHNHMLSDKDAFMVEERLIKRLKELGMDGIAVTDHGTLSVIEDLRRSFKAEGLKLIPGCEVYIDGGVAGRKHLVLLAKNDNGYFKGVSKVVTVSNYHLQDGFPVLTREELFSILEPVKDDVYVLSACMQGVICAILLQNNKVSKEIKKLEKKQEKYVSSESEEFISAASKVDTLDLKIKELSLEKDGITPVANMKFVAREKSVVKAEKNGDANAKSLRETLEADKIASKEASDRLNVIKKELDDLKKLRTEVNKEFQGLKSMTEKWDEINVQIEEMKSEYKDEEELYNLALEETKLYKEFFGENFYMEIQYHNIPEEAECFPIIVQIAKELNIPLVATNDCHMVDDSKEERLKRQILRSIRFGKWQEENVGDKELYIKIEDEMREILSKIFSDEDIEEAISNTSIIFDNCNVEFEMEKNYPVFSKTEDAKAILDREVTKGIKFRFPEGFPKGQEEEYQKRLDYELEIIKSMGYADYHLIVKDYIEYGKLLGYVPKELIPSMPLSILELSKVIKENGWLNGGMTIGPGRGSAAGSLVCYALGITNLDPIKYGLLFERFLNPERVSMPDIDVDFSKSIREQCIKYVMAKYGEKAVCGIMTKNAQAPKGVIRIAAKYYGLANYGEPFTALGDTIAKLVSNEVGVAFDSMVNEHTGKLDNDSAITLYEYLTNTFKSNKEAMAILEWAKSIEGLFTAYGAHAAGIVIAGNGDVSESLPLKYNSELGMMTTQCDMIQVEENGLLKFDFLGLKTLDIITDAGKMIEKNYGKIIDFLKVDMEDERVFSEIFSKGNTNAVFQFESAGMKSLLKRMKPTCFEDLIIAVSLYRPGAMQFLDDVIDVKNGKKEMSFLCPELESILAPTYGAMVYQEQVMAVCQKLAGFTLAHADNVRKYMSKKKADKLAHEEVAFVEGCITNGINGETAKTIFAQMMDFAKYAFNKSHAACYAFLAYITGWIKCYYPAEFFAAALNYTTYDKLPLLMGEARVMDVEVVVPSVNYAEKEFTVDEGKIVFGFSMVKGVGGNADLIIEERKNGLYKDLKDFLYRTKVGASTVVTLADAGAFDEFSGNRESVKLLANDVIEVNDKIKKKKSFIASAETVLPVIESDSETIIKKQEAEGLKVEIDKPNTRAKHETRIENAKKALEALVEEYNSYSLRPVKEDRKEKMEKEYALLGSYISLNPIDLYPSAEEIGTNTIKEGFTVPGAKTEIYGVIKNLRITARKSDGAKMAFFTLVDKSGEVDACVFAKAYTSLKTDLKDGNAYILKGKFAEKDSEDEETVYQFIVETVKSVEEKKSSYLLTVPSYVSFHLDVEETFIEEYEDKDGHDLYIFDKAMNEMRKATFKVNDRCIRLCEEINI